MVLFIHGGYWRALDKHDHSFIVPPLINAGAVVANVNYDLCPQVTLSQMSQQIVDAVRFCHANANDWEAEAERIILIGHSAGAHLSARVLNQPAGGLGCPADLISGVAAISGIYEPEIILKLDVNEEARITANDAIRNDCLSVPPSGNPRLALWAGADEPVGWIDQSRAYYAVARSAGLECQLFEETGTDHFTVLERSFEDGSDGWRTICDLLG